VGSACHKLLPSLVFKPDFEPEADARNRLAIPGSPILIRSLEAINRKRGSSSFRFSLKTLGLPQEIGVLGFRSSSGFGCRRWVLRDGAGSISSRW
jgi:hypothetical protein